jgi:hypothetical protein
LNHFNLVILFHPGWLIWGGCFSPLLDSFKGCKFIALVFPVITLVFPVITPVFPVITLVFPVITLVFTVITLVFPVITLVFTVITLVFPVITLVFPVKGSHDLSENFNFIVSKS